MLPKEIIIIGLGKMGQGIALNLANQGWSVYGYNRTLSVTKKLSKKGVKACESIEDAIHQYKEKRGRKKYPIVVWLMLPAGDTTTQVLEGRNGVVGMLDKNDIIIDGANAQYEETIERSKRLKNKVRFVDCGVSGGPNGARYGACTMYGANDKDAKYLKKLFEIISVKNGSLHVGKVGAGHYVKMVHNGIEYGMMQSIAEGFDVMKSAPFQKKLDLQKIAKLYDNGSVIESHLMTWLHDGFKKYGKDLKKIKGSPHASGEALWTVQEAKKRGVDVSSIKLALKKRQQWKESPTYAGKIVAVLRNMFGGHIAT